jgi:hypothetical protein
MTDILMTRVGMAEPPREVPSLVRLRLIFGGALSQIGWAALGFGMVFAWVFQAPEAIGSWWRFRGELQRTEGRITRISDARFSVNNSKIYAYHYDFELGDGRHSGVSYGREGKCSAGDKVAVEYATGRQMASRVVGMNVTKAGWGSLLVLIFPLIGLGFVLAGLARGRKGLGLLRDGKQVMGRLTDMRETGMKVNKRTVYRMTFAFQAGDSQSYEVVARTHQPEKLSGETLGDTGGPESRTHPPAEAPSQDGKGQNEVYEPLVYDPGNPSRAVLLDSLPGEPRIDETGRICVRSPVKSLLALVLPAAAIVGNIWYAVARHG